MAAYTLYELAKLCLYHDFDAEIDGDSMIARLYDYCGDSRFYFGIVRLI